MKVYDVVWVNHGYHDVPKGRFASREDAQAYIDADPEEGHNMRIVEYAVQGNANRAGYTPSETLEGAVRLLLESRERKGVETYGETLDTASDQRYDWPAMREEELLDALMYASREIRTLRSHLREQEIMTQRAEAEIHRLRAGLPA